MDLDDIKYLRISPCTIHLNKHLLDLNIKVLTDFSFGFNTLGDQLFAYDINNHTLLFNKDFIQKDIVLVSEIKTFFHKNYDMDIWIITMYRDSWIC